MENRVTQIIRTNEYELKLRRWDNSVILNLKQNSNKPKKQFESVLPFTQLPRQIRQKFLTMDNFYMYISDKDNITPNISTGLIQIKLLVRLANGIVISTTKLGEIRLNQVETIQDLNQIIKICKSQQKLNQERVKLILHGLAFNIQKIQQKNATIPVVNKFNDNNKPIDKGIEKVVEDCKQRINAIITNLHQHQMQIASIKSSNQYIQKLLKQQPKNVPINLTKQVVPMIDQKISQLKNKITQEFNYALGSIQNQFIKIQTQMDKIKLNQKQPTATSNSFQVHNKSSSNSYSSSNKDKDITVPGVTPGGSNVPTPPSNPAPLNQKGLAHSGMSNLDQVHQLIKIRTNKKMKKTAKADSMQKINRRHYFSNFFQFTEEGAIVYMNKQNRRVMLFWQQNILSNNLFSIKITKTKQRCVGIGIVDASYCKESICKVPVDTRPNLIYYEAHTGKIFQGPNFVGKQTNGVSQGQLTMVYVNLQLGLIAWVASGEIRANYITPKIIDYNIEWVPVVIFNHCDDTIQLFQQQK